MRGDMIPELSERQPELAKLCRDFNVQRLEIFGSASTDGFCAEDSDLDFLVEFERTDVGYANRYFGFLEALESLFERPVDLVVTSAIKNPFFREAVNKTRALLYAA
jgi:hypothetical protein